MTDIAIRYDLLNRTFDFVEEGGNLLLDDTLFTAVAASLYSNRRVELYELPESDRDSVLVERGGWWADALADDPNDLSGSRIWLFKRKTVDDETPNELRAYVREALDWMNREVLIDHIEVVAERNATDRNRVDGTLSIYLTQGGVRRYPLTVTTETS